MSFPKFRGSWQHVSRTIPAFVYVLLMVSMTDGEGRVTFEMSVENLLAGDFSVSSASATLENKNFSRSIELVIEDSKIHGTIADLADGKYTFHLELQDGNSTIAKSAASGYLRSGESRLITARTDLSCQKVTAIIDWDPTNSTDVKDFFSFSINPDSVTLKTYEGIENIETLAAEHAANGLQWFYRHRIWSNLDSNLVPIVKYNFGEHRNTGALLLEKPLSGCRHRVERGERHTAVYSNSLGEITYLSHLFIDKSNSFEETRDSHTAVRHNEKNIHCCRPRTLTALLDQRPEATGPYAFITNVLSVSLNRLMGIFRGYECMNIIGVLLEFDVARHETFESCYMSIGA